MGQINKEYDGKHRAEECRDPRYHVAEADLPLLRHPLRKFGRFFVVADRDFGTAHQRSHSLDKRERETDHAAHERNAHPLFPLFRRFDALRFHMKFSVIVADNRRHAALSAHHDALDHRLPADISTIGLFHIPTLPNEITKQPLSEAECF